ncbi:MAG: tRNA uridine-5-carboxymethylaminomethyl(34) synthesis GTPase MnmE [Sporomusaceae bacterium]|jgi:tRNA modification GTPase|nr:tRNA uridine-5-carboxymethylaminomethyl(34) synthesis GTPase MnmE [Sporomusaceae bacterium]
MNTCETICAVATALGEGSIGVIRLSGPDAHKIAAKMFKSKKGARIKNMPSFSARYGQIHGPNGVIDEAILLIMRGPSSYTGEDVAEIQCHASSAALKEILALALSFGAKLAEPGEFTKRAFLNSRLDLSQAEAVIDIIRAKTGSSLKAAQNNLAGALSAKIRPLRQLLLKTIAHLEAAIDFPEEDLEELSADTAAAFMQEALSEINLLLKTAATGKILREGLKTALIGRPNVGKSSLLNALAGEERAIVTDIAGTTRDVIEEYLNLDGIPLCVMDTAGIRKTDDAIEKLGVQKAKDVWREADLSLLLLDFSQELSVEDRDILAEVKANNLKNLLVLVNKSDLPPKLDLTEVKKYLDGNPVLTISAKEALGLSELKKAVAAVALAGGALTSDAVFVSNVRQTDLLRQSAAHLEDALASSAAYLPTDCIVIDLKLAWEKLGEITGESVGEDILTQIFSQFCLGK